MLLPAIDGAWISLFHWDGVTLATWAGIDNYVDALTDPLVQQSFVHALILIVFYSIGPVCLGLLVTAALSRHPMRGLTAFRTIVFVPQVLAAVVIGVAWQWMYDPQGPINSALTALGLDSLTRAWLGDFGVALPAVGLIGTWVTGAGPVREFFAVTLPGLRNEIVVALLLTVIDALRAFDIIFVTTKGGPGSETYVPTILIYKRAFVSNDVGSAAAVAAMLTAIVLIVSIGIRRLEEAREQ